MGDVDGTDRLASSHPQPRFAPLDAVVVVDRPLPDLRVGGIHGQRGVVIWRTAYFVERSRWGLTGWLYVVDFPAANRNDGVEESRLVAIDEVVPAACCLAAC